ncbi:MAG: glycosyltransferase [Chitinophagia bacterium]|nr:glycosyltransferase [Chitinophagia bacterium]
MVFNISFLYSVLTESHLSLDILIPVYEPHDGWAEELIVQYRILLSRLPENIEPKLIVVNDGSKKQLESDGEYIKSLLPDTQWISYSENRGKGHALRTAASNANADYIMYTDYDFPYTYGSMVNMLNTLMKEGTEAVVGHRDESYYSHISPRRKTISQILKIVNKLIFRLPTNDTQCGLKAFRITQRELLLKTSTDRYLIDVEFLKKLSRSKAHVAVVPVKLREGVVLSKISNLSLMKEMFNYLRILVFG